MGSNREDAQVKVIIARPRRPAGKTRWWLLGLAGFLIGLAGGVGAYFFPELGIGPLMGPFPFHHPFAGRDQVNVLVIGTDDIGDGLADSLIVARVDVARRRVGIVSVPRDARANIPGVDGVRKINSAHALGGNELTQAAVSQLLGVPIDYYVQVNSAGLADLVEAAGGVEIEVGKRMHYRDRRGNLSIDLQPGLQRLNGEQAVGYVRFRYDALGDIGRMQRQQNFLRALAKQLATAGTITRIPALVQAFLKTVDTNLSARDLTYLAGLARQINLEDAPMATLPGEPVTLSGVSCLQLDAEGVKQTVAEVLYGKPCEVEVVDASGDGQGERIVQLLEEKGMRVVSTRVGPEQAASRIINYHGRPERARELLHLVSCKRLVHGDNPYALQDFTIEVGRDLNTAANNSSAQQQ